MAENITDGQIRSGSEFDEFDALLRNIVPENRFINREEIDSAFNGLSAVGQHVVLHVLLEFYSSLRTGADELQETEIYGAPASSHFPPISQGSQESYELQVTQIPAASRFRPLSQGSQASYGILPVTEMYTYGGHYAGATRDNETAGHSKLFGTLLPVNFTNAYKAGKILKSTYHILQPSIKASGYLSVAMAATAVFSSLAGLSLSTFKPSTLPCGCNPQLMLEIMHCVAVHTTAYAFIGTMCHEFLQDDPFIMWIVAGLASALFMTVMVFFGRRI